MNEAANGSGNGRWTNQLRSWEEGRTEIEKEKIKEDDKGKRESERI